MKIQIYVHVHINKRAHYSATIATTRGCWPKTAVFANQRRGVNDLGMDRRTYGRTQICKVPSNNTHRHAWTPMHAHGHARAHTCENIKPNSKKCNKMTFWVFF